MVPDFSQWTPADWSAAGTVVTAVVALVAALFAAWQVWLLRSTREDQARPFVYVDIQPSPVWSNILNLVIENTGTTVAHDVELRFVPEIETAQPDYNLGDSALLREGIPSVPPRRRIEILFDVSHERLEHELPLRYEVTVNCSNARRKEQEPLHYTIDLNWLYGAQTVEELGVHHAAKALKGIEELLKNSSPGTWMRRE